MLERIKFWLLIGLLVSNLAVGLLSLRYLNNISGRYSAVIDSSLPLLNQLRTLTRELSTVQRLARRVVDPRNEPTWDQLVAELNETSNKSRSHAAAIGAMEGVRGSSQAAAIIKQGEIYDGRVDEFLKLIHDKRIEEATRFNSASLRPIYDDYMQVLDGVADYVQQREIDQRMRATKESRVFTGFMLAFAGWPLVAVGLGLAAMFVLMLALLISVFAPGLGRRNQSGPSAG